MYRLSRANALKSAALLPFLMGIHGLVQFMPLLVGGVTAVSQAGNGPPYFVVILVFVQAIVRIVTAYAVWHQQRLGIIWTLVANVLDTCDAVSSIPLHQQ